MFLLRILRQTSVSDPGAQTKRPKGQNVPRQNVLRHKVPRTKRPKDKMSQGQNVPRDKTSQGKKFYISISNFSKTDFVRIFLKMGHIC